MAEYFEKEKLCDWCLNTGPSYCDICVMNRHDLPAADVRPVVMCKECKWTKTDGMEDPAIYCEKWDRWEMPPDGFCWLGKKREES